jgi:peptide subunit release factor 1 (eRF1)
MDLRERVNALARLPGAASPVVSVYLDTRWADEHQRERVRVFLSNGLRKARTGAGTELRADLDWIEEQGDRLVAQATVPEADGVALFACGPLGLREILTVRVPFQNAFVVAERPLLTPLAALAEEALPAIVVFVDGSHARLIPIDPAGQGDELTLEHGVPGRHSRGGWALMAQSRYQRHVEVHRDQHFEAVAEALQELSAQQGGVRIVLAGEDRMVAAFRSRLPTTLAGRVAGTISAARYETASTLADRATALLARLDASEQERVLNEVLTEAAKGGQAIAGVEGTLHAVGRGAVRRLYLLRGFSEAGAACTTCAAMQPGEAATCRACGGPTKRVCLGDEVVDRVVTAGGEIAVIDAHAALERAGGMAALLRFPL